MNTIPVKTSLLSEDEAATKAAVEYLQKRYPKMTEETAALWARAMAAEQGEMNPELASQVQDARAKAQEVMKRGKENYIRRGFEESLKKNDFFEAVSFFDDAAAVGIDLSDLLENTPTQLDKEALKRGEIPLSAIS